MPYKECLKASRTDVVRTMLKLPVVWREAVPCVNEKVLQVRSVMLVAILINLASTAEPATRQIFLDNVIDDWYTTYLNNVTNEEGGGGGELWRLQTAIESLASLNLVSCAWVDAFNCSPGTLSKVMASIHVSCYFSWAPRSRTVTKLPCWTSDSILILLEWCKEGWGGMRKLCTRIHDNIIITCINYQFFP